MTAVTRLRLSLRWRIRLALAHFVRWRRRGTTFVGVTGSAGKTTTKDLAVAILAGTYATIGNPETLNILDDLARMMLKVKYRHRFAVFEIAVGGEGRGSLDPKVALVRPKIAAMTVIARDHIKSFGSIEAIAEEKGKLVRALPKDGTAVLNIDDPLIRKIGEGILTRRIWFGRSPDADLRLLDARSTYPDTLTLQLAYQGKNYTCETSLHGTQLTVPVLAAIGIGLAGGLPIEKCLSALGSVAITPGRMQVLRSTAGVTFIRDDLKAPHWAFQDALDYLRDARATRKVAVIGTLSDYSLSASKLYPKVARAAMDVADLVVFVGPHALRALKARSSDNEKSLVGFSDIASAHRFLQGELREGDLVLVKGSNRADHLVRLIVARERPVNCWVSDCGLHRFCDDCNRLSQPSETTGAGSQSAIIVRRDADLSVPVTKPVEGVANVWLLVGLGNSGDEYSGTPHNVGFEVADRLAKRFGLRWQSDPEGEICRGDVQGHDLVLFKASTPMNLTGPAVERVRGRYGVSRDRIIVVHDDVDLQLGRVRIKRNGSDGGHRGLRSVFSALSNDGFMIRVRVGVRRDQSEEGSAKAIVLKKFAFEDEAAVRTGVESAAQMLEELLDTHERST